MNRYQITALTPLLVGDGQQLSPIDYMVWRDQVNILDQRRIFRLLSKGPRLEGYLVQIRKAEKLDFASWGGYAQNFALRRIPFEHTGCTAIYERARAEELFIPTFATGPQGVYLPATALKGPLRTAMLMQRTGEAQLKELTERMTGERPVRRPAEPMETAVLGASGVSRTRSIMIADSDPLAAGQSRIYQTHVSTLVQRGPKLELGWKLSPRGSVDGRRAAESTPQFAEMVVPGTTFTGGWGHPNALTRAEVLRALRWKEATAAQKFAQAANASAETMIQAQMQYAEMAGLGRVLTSLQGLKAALEEARQQPASCLVCIGWGGGYLSKSALAGAPDATKELLRNHPFYGRAIQTGLPFPKTRRIVFMGGEPAALPGWAKLSFSSGN